MCLLLREFEGWVFLFDLGLQSRAQTKKEKFTEATPHHPRISHTNPLPTGSET